MQQKSGYVAPSKTAQLVGCLHCKGAGVASQTVRIVSEMGEEHEQPQTRVHCDGSGKLWEDTQDVQKIVQQDGPGSLIGFLGGLMILLLGFLAALQSMSAIQFGLSFVLVFFGLWGLLLAGGGTSSRVEAVSETVHIKTGDKVEVKDKLMQQ